MTTRGWRRSSSGCSTSSPTPSPCSTSTSPTRPSTKRTRSVSSAQARLRAASHACTDARISFYHWCIQTESTSTTGLLLLLYPQKYPAACDRFTRRHGYFSHKHGHLGRRPARLPADLRRPDGKTARTAIKHQSETSLPPEIPPTLRPRPPKTNSSAEYGTFEIISTNVWGC